jgi:PIN domain nuclease of toxin-antitoxin system
MTAVVFDASVVVAAVLKEPGGHRVAGHAERPMISAVNYAEVRTKLADLGMNTVNIDATLDVFALDVVSFDEAQAGKVAELRESTRRAGLSLGDRACIVLAAARGTVALTADRAWQRAELPISIEYIR